ncbi:hypothetical protein Zmor_019355 [Zophobas morio]|uniref:Transmembrane protein n=1 Tax=Zophobas morio TaxID=2755281 RepID=A0AA38I1I3_9CUCU|nr:hypothetical protein Zmor_019355 [Zophobas morio]
MCLFQKYVNAFKILHFQNQILGITVLNTTKNGFKKSNFRIYCNLLALILFSNYTVYTIYTKATIYKSQLLLQTVELIMVVANCTYVVAVWLLAITKHQKTMQLLSKVIHFDQNLHKMGVRINYQKQKKRNLVQLLFNNLKIEELENQKI